MYAEVVVPIAAPIETVWDLLVDVERWPTWTDSMRSVTIVDGGPLTIGSTVRIKQPGLPLDVWVVTELESPRRLTWEAEGTGTGSQAVHELTVTGDGACELRLVVQLVGSMSVLVGLVLGRRIRRLVRQEADGLKARAEA